MENIKLNSGFKIPQVGLGTSRLRDKDKLKKIIEDAIDIGYRHFDFAPVYNNESMIGEILEDIFKKGNIKRQDLFYTSKLWNAHHKMAEWAIKRTLKDLKTDYLDLYLIHWPVTFKSNENGDTILKDDKPELETYEIDKLWPIMESFVTHGYVRSIGVANHGIENISRILKICKIKPAMCQIELHPYWLNKDVTLFCSENNIAVTSYASLGSQKTEGVPSLLDDIVLQELAKSKNMTVAQLILAWITMKKIIVIPKASSYERLKENFNICEITEIDASVIESLTIKHKYFDLPQFGPDRFK